MARVLRLFRSAALEEERNEAVRGQLQAIDASSGKYGDSFDGDYLSALRREWPE